MGTTKRATKASIEKSIADNKALGVPPAGLIRPPERGDPNWTALKQVKLPPALHDKLRKKYGAVAWLHDAVATPARVMWLYPSEAWMLRAALRKVRGKHADIIRRCDDIVSKQIEAPKLHT